MGVRYGYFWFVIDEAGRVPCADGGEGRCSVLSTRATFSVEVCRAESFGCWSSSTRSRLWISLLVKT